MNIGAGVTAHSEDDARHLATAAFPQARVSTIAVVEDLGSLDKGHVAPNMGSALSRGIWFPLGFEAVALEVT